jgi:hypothetical protein
MALSELLTATNTENLQYLWQIINNGASAKLPKYMTQVIITLLVAFVMADKL